MRLKTIIAVLFLSAAAAFSQTPATAVPSTNTITQSVAAVDPAITALQTLKLPTYIFGGISYDPAGGFKGVISGITPIANQAKLYGALTADISAVRGTDLTTGKPLYYLSPQFRAGFYKDVYDDGSSSQAIKNMFLVGLDAGAAFSSTGTGTTVGATYGGGVVFSHSFSRHIAMSIPVRVLWVPNAIPGASGVPSRGAFKLTPEIGLVWVP